MMVSVPIAGLAVFEYPPLHVNISLVVALSVQAAEVVTSPVTTPLPSITYVAAASKVSAQGHVHPFQVMVPAACAVSVPAPVRFADMPG
jgi:hypothetical protein